MTKDTFELLARYNAHANRSMNQILETLSEEEWNRPQGTYFAAIRDLCNHIYLSDVHGLLSFRALRSFSSLRGEPFDFPPARAEAAFRTFAEYRPLRERIDEIYVNFVGETTNQDLAADVAYRNFRGEELTKNVAGRLLHLFNHQTHHRGQISALLDQIGKSNDFSGVMAVL